MNETASPAAITVFAGTNGCGKSSIAGAMLRERGGHYFNPDEATQLILAKSPILSLNEANSRAWVQGKRSLEEAIANNRRYMFETTLGGRTITGLLHEAIDSGIPVDAWYAGLASPDLHIARVAKRVERGGHDVPEGRIRQRYHSSLQNLIGLLPRLRRLQLFDNSKEDDPATGAPPQPVLLLHMEHGLILAPDLEDLDATPPWAKAVVAAAMATHLDNTTA